MLQYVSAYSWDQISLPSDEHCFFVFGRCLVQILAWRLAVLAEAFHDFINLDKCWYTTLD
jgi:hypothetical protein